jgi:hypothetical protein
MYDIDLPLTGGAGIECRFGPSNSHQAIMNFPGPVTVTNASVRTGTGSVSSFAVNGSQVSVNLTAVTNAQTIVVTLSGVSNGTLTGNVNIPIRFLLGDTTGNGSVTSSDISQTKSNSSQPDCRDLPHRCHRQRFD